MKQKSLTSQRDAYYTRAPSQSRVSNSFKYELQGHKNINNHTNKSKPSKQRYLLLAGIN